MIGITCFTNRAKKHFSLSNRAKNSFSLSSRAKHTPVSTCPVKTSLQSQQLNRFSFQGHVARSHWLKAAVTPSSYLAKFEQSRHFCLSSTQNKLFTLNLQLHYSPPSLSLCLYFFNPWARWVRVLHCRCFHLHFFCLKLVSNSTF